MRLAALSILGSFISRTLATVLYILYMYKLACCDEQNPDVQKQSLEDAV